MDKKVKERIYRIFGVDIVEDGSSLEWKKLTAVKGYRQGSRQERSDVISRDLCRRGSLGDHRPRRSKQKNDCHLSGILIVRGGKKL
jgi:hypothetical protein